MRHLHGPFYTDERLRVASGRRGSSSTDGLADAMQPQEQRAERSCDFERVMTCDIAGIG